MKVLPFILILFTGVIMLSCGRINKEYGQTFEEWSDSIDSLENAQQEELIECYDCDGKGYIPEECPTCDGTGRLIERSTSTSTRTCQYCAGTGIAPCNRCENNGTIKCSSCSGFGKVLCRQCDHSGVVLVGNTYLRCSVCGGEGFHSCLSCGGNGRFNCNMCGGRGHLSCSYCNGSGGPTISNTVSNDIGECPTCNGTGIYRKECELCGGEGEIPAENSETEIETPTPPAPTPPAPTPPAPPTPPSRSTLKVVVNGDGVRLRYGPGTDFKYMTWPNGQTRSPSKGTKLDYIGQKGDWYKVKFQGEEYYISKQFSYIE